MELYYCSIGFPAKVFMQRFSCSPLNNIALQCDPWAKHYPGISALLWKLPRCQIKTRRSRLIRNFELIPSVRLTDRGGGEKGGRRPESVSTQLECLPKWDGRQNAQKAISALLIQPKRIPGHLWSGVLFWSGVTGCNSGGPIGVL